MTTTQTLVYGEPLTLLAEALAPMAKNGRIEDDGIWHYEGRWRARRARAPHGGRGRAGMISRERAA